MTPANGEGPRIGPFEVYEFAETKPNSPHSPSLLHDDIPFKPSFTDHLAHYFARLRFLVVRYDNTWTRALLRFFSGLTAGSPMVAALLQLPDASPGDERLISIGIAAAFAVAIAWLLRRPWFNGSRGMAWGALLWLLSCLWFNGISTIALAVWQYVDGEASDLSEVIFGAVIGVALLIGASLALKKFDPDF
jgi:hypothetical protein